MSDLSLSLDDGRWILVDEGPFRLLGHVMSKEEMRSHGDAVAALMPLVARTGVLLSPVYEVIQVEQEVAGKGTALALRLTPYGLFGLAVPVYVLPSAIALVQDLSDIDREMLRQLLGQAENVKTALRAGRAGLAVAKR